jgi:hypothetical protein
MQMHCNLGPHPEWEALFPPPPRREPFFSSWATEFNSFSGGRVIVYVTSKTGLRWKDARVNFCQKRDARCVAKREPGAPKTHKTSKTSERLTRYLKLPGPVCYQRGSNLEIRLVSSKGLY